MLQWTQDRLAIRQWRGSVQSAFLARAWRGHICARCSLRASALAAKGSGSGWQEPRRGYRKGADTVFGFSRLCGLMGGASAHPALP